MATAILLVLVAVGSVVFHFLSPWWWTPIASNWAYIDHTIIITFWITGVVFVAVVLFTAYCVYRPGRLHAVSHGPSRGGPVLGARTLGVLRCAPSVAWVFVFFFFFTFI